MLGRKSKPKSETTDDKRGFDAFDLRLGDIMRGERATLGKSLLDVQRELKIKATYIAAVENSDVSVFETPGFIAGYVRSYARYLGLDPQWAFERFCSESGFSGAEGLNKTASAGLSAKANAKAVPLTGLRSDETIMRPVAPYAPSGESVFDAVEPRALGSIAIVLLLIGALGYGGFSVLQEVQRVQFAPVDQAPGVVAEVDILPGTTLPGGTSVGTETAGLTAPTADALDRLYRPQALEAPVLTARDGPIANLDPGTIGALVEPGAERFASRSLGATGLQDAPVTPTPVKVLADDAPEVVLFAVRPAWVRVADLDGTVLFEKILDGGERYVVPTTDTPPILRAGNSGSLFFSVLGETLGPAGPGTSVAKNVALSVEEIVANYEAADSETDPALTEDVMTAAAAPLSVDAVLPDEPAGTNTND